MRGRALLFLILLPILIAPGIAKEEKKPSEMYAEKEAKFLRAIGAKYVELAEFAKKFSLFEFARNSYEAAIEFEPNNRKARIALGYVRRGRTWELDPGEALNLPKQNTKSSKTSQQSFDGFKRDFKEMKEKTELFVAKKYSGLGKWCAKNGLNYQAVKAFENALKFDTENKDARAGLGFKKVDGKWRTKKQIQAMKEAKEGKLVEGQSRYESALGIKLNKMESGHFHIETVFPIPVLKEYIKACETTYAYFLKDVGEDPEKDIFGRKATIIVLGTKAQWIKYVNVLHGGSERNRKFTAKLKGDHRIAQLFSAKYEGEDGSQATTIDGLVHVTGHFLAHHYWGITQSWLGEGFAFYYTVKVLNTTQTHCTSLGDYKRNFSGEKKWGKSENWKGLLKEEVVGKGDPDIRMFYGQQFGELQYMSTVKSWSIITFLFDKRREDFQKWLFAVGKDNEKQDESMQEILGMSFEQLDIAWREYVIENY